MMRVSQPQAVRQDLVAQRVGAVDADVAALVGVVLVGQRPAHLLGQPPRDRDRQRATGFQYPHELGNGPVVLRNMLEDLRRDNAVERAVGVRQVERVALDRLGPRGCRDLALVLHRLQNLVDVV